MTETQRLLQDYAGSGSEAAFRELVGRYLDLVHSAAFRLVNGKADLAEDVAQIVFIDLARKAQTMPQDVMLGGWLHRHTCFVAGRMMRSERRRQMRERQAAEMNSSNEQAEGNPDQISVILDETIDQLGAEDRTAILLRFFEGRDFRTIGATMGNSEAAAQKRVARALEKLQLLLKRRGVLVSAGALGPVLTATAVTAAPSQLTARIAASALASAGGGGSAALTLFKIMSMTKIQFGMAALIVAAAVTSTVLQEKSRLRAEAENHSLQQQIAQMEGKNRAYQRRLGRPPRQITAQPHSAPSDASAIKDYVARNGPPVKLTRAQVDAYLRVNGTNAATLVSAFHCSADPSLLQQAMEKYPNDPRVSFAAIFQSGLSPQEQRQWINNFEQSAPDNSLANYLSALNYFQSGQSDLAAQELSAAAGKPQFQNYAQDAIQNDDEAFLAAGYSEAEAKLYGGQQLQMAPLNSGLKELGADMVGLAAAYQQSGDQASSQAALQMAVQLGQRLDGTDGPFVISQMMGMNIERTAFNAMDPSASYGDTGQTVQDQINQIDQQRASLNDLNNQVQSIIPSMTSSDWINYRERELLFGQISAAQWIVNKNRQP